MQGSVGKCLNEYLVAAARDPIPSFFFDSFVFNGAMMEKARFFSSGLEYDAVSGDCYC